MNAPSPFIADLLAECHSLHIRLTPAGADRLTIDAPQDALTPNLLARLKTHKPHLLAALHNKPRPTEPTSIEPISIEPTSIEPPNTNHDPQTIWQATLARLAANPELPPDLLADLQTAEVLAITTPTDAPLPFPAPGDLDPHALHACPHCRSLELWQTLCGHWRCLHCDPPTTSRRLQTQAHHLRHLHPPRPTEHVSKDQSVPATE